MKLRFHILSLILLYFTSAYSLVWYDGSNPVSFCLPEKYDPVVKVAADMFSSDMQAVTGKSSIPGESNNSMIRLYQLDASDASDIKLMKKVGIDVKALQNLTDGFAIKVSDGAIHVAGANGRGTAYGLLELSRIAGVSPWIWWGDVTPAKKDILTIDDDFSEIQGASVEYRGISITDENWSLRPWSHLNFEPTDKAEIGASTYRKIFELLLRLRANTLLPAMQEGTTRFSQVEGAKQQADSCGIIIGMSLDDVSLLWSDDNYGYMARLGNEKNQKQSGGTGVFYHLSYSGQPHDYLWLTTTQPGLIWHQMRQAYDRNADKLWIVNVHDPKVAGYDLELFLDMAWNVDSVDASTLKNHYKNWLTREFGEKAAELIFPVMYNFYRLCGERRPEFMGWSQVEKDSNLYERGLTPVIASDFNQDEFGNELMRYANEFDKASYVIDYATKFVDPSLYDAYFTAVIYPVCASAAHARSLLNAQVARSLASGRDDTLDRNLLEEQIMQASTESMRAYQELRKLTEYYNDVVSDGKWKWSMDMRPRDLPVFLAPSLPVVPMEYEMQRYPRQENLENAYPIELGSVVAVNADSFSGIKGKATPVNMLGHSMNAVSLDKGSSVSYDFNIVAGGEGVIRIAFIPTHALDGEDLRIVVKVDGSGSEPFSIKAPVRSDKWKQNVMRGQAIIIVPTVLDPGTHKLEIKALDDNIVIDQWMWDPIPDRKFYLFPIE